MQDIRSHATGRTAGEAVVLGDSTVDMGKLFNVQQEKNAAAHQKYLQANKDMDELGKLSYNAWSTDQKGVDDALNQYKIDKADLLYKRNGQLTYDDERQLQERQAEIARKALLSNEDKANNDRIMKEIEQDRKGKQIINYDATSKKLLEEQQKPLGERNYNNIIVTNEKPKLETAATSVNKVYNTDSTTTKNDGTTISDTKHDVNVEGSVGNWLKVKPTVIKGIRYDNKAVANNEAVNRKYKDYKDWQANDAEGFNNWVSDNYLNDLTGGATHKELHDNNSSFNTSFGSATTAFVDGKMTSITTNTAIKNADGTTTNGSIYYKAIPISGGGKSLKITLPAEKNSQILNTNTGKYETSLTGNIDMDASQLALIPSIKNPDKLDKIKTFFRKDPKLWGIIEGLKLGKSYDISEKNVKAIKAVLGDKYNDYFEDKQYLVGKVNNVKSQQGKRTKDEYGDVTDTKGQNKLQGQFAVPFTPAVRQAFITSARAAKVSEKVINEMLKSYDNYGKSTKTKISW